MPASADPRRTLLDPWVDTSRGSTINNNSSSFTTRARPSARDQNRHPTKSDALWLRTKEGRGSRIPDSEQTRILNKYEASVAKTLNHHPGRPGSHSPAMDIWAMALGVDIEHSKATERARRKVELEEAGQSTGRGAWASAVPSTAPNPTSSSNRSVKRDNDTLHGLARRRRGPVVPEITALGGFLSELQGRLKSVEGGAVRSSNTVVPTPASVGGCGGGSMRVLKRAAPGVAVRDEYDRVYSTALTGVADIYGIPQAFITNAEEVRKCSPPRAVRES